MVIMLIIVTGVVGMYNIYNESVRLSDLTAQRLQAIQIAREWIEALENIRNTNWILYASDYQDCWNTLNYQSGCIPDINLTTTDIVAGSYLLYQNADSRWQLDRVDPAASDFSPEYREDFEVFRDDNGFYTQDGSSNTLVTKTPLTPIFTREIQIRYPSDSNDSSMNVASIVKWDGRADNVHTVELNLNLTNWKNDN